MKKKLPANQQSSILVYSTSMRRMFFILIPLVLMGNSLCFSSELYSPDKQYKAVIEPYLAPGNNAQENIIKIIDADNKVLAQKDFRSESKEHGYIINHAEWTADTKFFIFSCHSSGGHQPWNSPAFFFSTVELKIYSLDDLIGPVLDSEIQLINEHEIKVNFHDRITNQEKTETINLDMLIKNR